MVSSFWILHHTGSKVSVLTSSAHETVTEPLARKTVTVAPLLILVIFRGHILACHRSEYQIGNECCPMCHPGNRVKTDCTEFRSTSCIRCSDGTFMNRFNGLKNCLHCATCDAASGLKIKTSCTEVSDTVCEPLEGFYCLDSAEDGCAAAQKHTSCQPGQYVSQKGTALSDTVCSDCSSGTYSDGTFTSCRPHTQCESGHRLKNPGTGSTDAECEEQSLSRTGVVIGIVVVVFLLLLIGASVFLVYHRKKKRRLNRERKGIEDNPNLEHMNGEETSRMNETHVNNSRTRQFINKDGGSLLDTAE